MTNEELKEALLSGEAVDYVNQYGELVRYGCVNAIRMYREKIKDGYKLSFAVELLDKSGRSITVVPAERVVPAIESREEDKLHDNRKNKD